MNAPPQLCLKLAPDQQRCDSDASCRICDWCNGRLLRLIERYRDRDLEGEDVRLLSTISTAASRGCRVCRLVEAGVRTFPEVEEPTWKNPMIHVQAVVLIELEPECYTVRFRCPWSEDLFEFCSHSRDAFMAQPTFQDTAEKDGFQGRQDMALTFFPMTSPNSEDLNCLVKARKWLSECQRNHTHCQVSTGAVRTPLPSRVIRVSDPPVLYETCGELEPYVTLSHCWGKSQHFTTTSKNIEALRKEISWQVLPKTFRDAITTTRALEIEYIWIDSLCIIQDSRDDWAQELSKMSGIYKNAVLNIAAAAAANHQSGFLGPRPSIEHRALGRVVGFPDDLLVRRFVEPPDEDERQDIEPLYTRGWVLQERLLASRILHFKNQGMVWDCNTTYFTEDGLHENEEENPRFSFTRAFRDYHENVALREAQAPVDHDFLPEYFIFNFWHHLVGNQYTKLNLTNAEDKLPALAGLADEFKLHTGDTYLAGLWRSDMVNGLLWHCWKSGSLPEKYRAPTWSWASIESKDMYYGVRDDRRNLRHLDAIVLDAKVEATGITTTGPVSSGFLKLAALCFSMRLDWRDNQTQCWCLESGLDSTFSKEGGVHRIDQRRFEDDSWSYSHFPVFYPDTILSEVSCDTADKTRGRGLRRSTPEARPDTVTGEVYCLLLTVTEENDLSFLVVSHGAETPGSWQRLGLLEIPWDPDLEDGLEQRLSRREFIVV